MSHIPNERISRQEYYMAVADLTAQRGTCLRLRTGCVIVGDGKVVSTGYNSSHRGTKHCTDPSVGCLLEDGHCVRCLHAEEAAVVNMETRRIKDLVLYVTHTPCIRCYKLLTSIGVKRIFYREAYTPITAAYQTLINEVEVRLIRIEHV